MKEIYKLATTSFIYYDTRLMNTLKLMHLFDEIELLYFESFRIYDQVEENELFLLNRLDVGYCPHLPYDRDITVKDDYEVMDNFIAKLSSLKASYFFYHSNGRDFDEMMALFSKYPNVLVENVKNTKVFDELNHTNIEYCFDVGHALVYGEDPYQIFSKFSDKIKYIHLHGVKGSSDHLELHYLDDRLLCYILDFAIEKRIGISIELFGFNKLLNSLNHLLEVFRRYGYVYYRWN